MPKTISIDGVEYYLIPVKLPEKATPLTTIGLKPSVVRGLKESLGVEYLEDCLNYNEAELRRSPHLGPKTLNTINEKLLELYRLRIRDLTKD